MNKQGIIILIIQINTDKCIYSLTDSHIIIEKNGILK